MARKRTTYSPEFKLAVVLESFSSELSLKELAQKHNIIVKNLTNWREQFLTNAHLAFEEDTNKQTLDSLKIENAELEKELAQANAEQEFIRKNFTLLRLK